MNFSLQLISQAHPRFQIGLHLTRDSKGQLQEADKGGQEETGQRHRRRRLERDGTVDSLSHEGTARRGRRQTQPDCSRSQTVKESTVQVQSRHSFRYAHFDILENNTRKTFFGVIYKFLPLLYSQSSSSSFISQVSIQCDILDVHTVLIKSMH